MWLLRLHCDDCLVEMRVHRINVCHMHTCIFTNQTLKLRLKQSVCSGYRHRQFAEVWLVNQVMSDSMCSGPFCQKACAGSCHAVPLVRSSED